MTIQLTQVYKNNMYKDDMYVTISQDSEIEDLLYLKFYNNINSITVEISQTPSKELLRKVLLIEHIDKIVYRNQQGIKEEISANRKLVIKMNEREDSKLISDDTIIKFQQILEISGNLAVVQSANVLNNELLDVLQKGDIEYVRVMDYGENKFTLQQIKSIKSKIAHYVKVASAKPTQMEKFVELYTTLKAEISVDNLGTSAGNVSDLVYSKTTMAGFAEILNYILNEIRIENNIIQGKLASGQHHAWNQVRIDFVWYNVDLALDIIKSTDISDMKYCLKRDVDFYEDHMALSQNIEICSQSSSYFIVKEIEEKESIIIRLFKKLAKLMTGKKVKKLNTGDLKYE